MSRFYYRQTDGCSGAECASVCQDAALEAMNEDMNAPNVRSRFRFRLRLTYCDFGPCLTQNNPCTGLAKALRCGCQERSAANHARGHSRVRRMARSQRGQECLEIHIIDSLQVLWVCCSLHIITDRPKAVSPARRPSSDQNPRPRLPAPHP